MFGKVFDVGLLAVLVLLGAVDAGHRHAMGNSIVHKHTSSGPADFMLDFHVGEFDAILYWKVDWHKQALNFSLLFNEKIPELFLLGFSDHGLLEGGLDVCVGNMTSSDSGLLRDGYVEYVNGAPEFGIDLHNDFLFRDFIRHSNGSVTIHFDRKFMTCDPRDIAIDTGTVNIFFFPDPHIHDWNLANMPMQLRSVVLIRHAKMGEYPLVADENAKPGSTEWYLDLTMNNSRISEEPTTYWCKSFKLDKYYTETENYILQSEVILSSGSEHMVHHGLLYMCAEPVNYDDDCFKEGLNPRILQSCNKAMTGWAMGVGPITFPAGTGFPLRSGGRNIYVLVEIHYHNIDRVRNKTDNSGFRLLFTNKPQKYDVGILEVGLTFSDANSIPPGQKSWPMTGYCMPQCTKNFPEGGINVFGSLLHSHLAGRRIYTSHFRNGVKIGEINRDNHFYTHWQHFQSFENFIHVHPGDMLTTTCVYDTSRRHNWTLGGYGTDDEMCLNILLYYPATDVTQCQTAVDNSTLHAFFAEHGIEDNNLNISEKYKRVEWNQKKLNSLQELYHVGPLNVNCVNPLGQLLPAGDGESWENVSRPELLGGVYERVRGRDQCLAMNDY